MSLFDLRQQRPAGLTIFSAILMIQGTLGMVAVLLVLSPTTTSNTWTVGRVCFAGLLATLTLVAAKGLWELRPWAFWLAIVLEGLNVVCSVLLAFTISLPWSASVLNIGIPFVILVYLVDPYVRYRFRVR